MSRKVLNCGTLYPFNLYIKAMSLLTRDLCQKLKDAGFEQKPIEQDFIYKGEDEEPMLVSDPKKIRKGTPYLRCPCLETMMKELKKVAGVVTVEMDDQVWVARPKDKEQFGDLVGMGAVRDAAAAMLWIAIKTA